jgi:hypothetical protein
MKKESLIRDYCDLNLTQYQIAEKYNISQQTVSRKMKEFGIEVKPYHKNPDFVFNQEEIYFLVGKILGDGSIYKGVTSANHRLGFAHKEDQKEYVYFCYDKIKRWCNTEPTYREQNRDPQIYSTSILKKYALESISHPEFSRLHRYFYEHGRKIVNQDILSNFNDLSLAIFYQDDGSLEVDNRTGKINGAKLHLNQFALESVLLFQSDLDKKFNIKSNPNKSQIGKDGRPQYCLRISKSSLETFFEVIKPNMCKSMLYKISR